MEAMKPPRVAFTEDERVALLVAAETAAHERADALVEKHKDDPAALAFAAVQSLGVMTRLYWMERRCEEVACARLGEILGVDILDTRRGVEQVAALIAELRARPSRPSTGLPLFDYVPPQEPAK
jgi:hypothetical protein